MLRLVRLIAPPGRPLCLELKVRRGPDREAQRAVWGGRAAVGTQFQSISHIAASGDDAPCSRMLPSVTGGPGGCLGFMVNANQK